jgi:hypothetical protein
MTDSVAKQSWSRLGVNGIASVNVNDCDLSSCSITQTTLEARIDTWFFRQAARWRWSCTRSSYLVLARRVSFFLLFLSLFVFFRFRHIDWLLHFLVFQSLSACILLSFSHFVVESFCSFVVLFLLASIFYDCLTFARSCHFIVIHLCSFIILSCCQSLIQSFDFSLFRSFCGLAISIDFRPLQPLLILSFYSSCLLSLRCSVILSVFHSVILSPSEECASHHPAILLKFECLLKLFAGQI